MAPSSLWQEAQQCQHPACPKLSGPAWDRSPSHQAVVFEAPLTCPHLLSSPVPAYLGDLGFCAFPNPPVWAMEGQGQGESALCFICKAFCLACPLPTCLSLLGELTAAGQMPRSLL